MEPGHDWLVRLRWLVALGHLALLGATVALGGEVLWVPALAVLGVGVLSNLVLTRATHAALLDVVLLTILLAATGGASNPFTFLYLLQVVLAAMILPSTHVWLVVGLAACGYGALFWVAPAGGHHHHDAMQSHFAGMWLAFAVSGPFAAFGVTRVRAVLAEAEARVLEARQLKARSERLSALGTLAAGAAHELATPLSTIAVVAKELEGQHAGSEVAEDAALIGAQVARCRTVLAQLTAASGHGMGEASRAISLSELGRSIVAELPDERVRVEATDGERLFRVPVDLVCQAARRLLQNALDASGPDAEVVLSLAGDDALRIRVTDRGAGMTPEVLARAGDPFFTTRPPGQGMGLGLHFARSVAEQLGGGLVLESRPDRGTTATLTFPREVDP